MNDNYHTVISNNLDNYPEDMKKRHFKKTLEKDEIKYTVNNYYENEDGYFYVYKNCPISKDIRNNIIWEKHIHKLIEYLITNIYLYTNTF